MSLRVDFYGVYRPLVGGKTIEFELEPAATLRDLLETVVRRFPSLREPGMVKSTKVRPKEGCEG